MAKLRASTVSISLCMLVLTISISSASSDQTFASVWQQQLPHTEVPASLQKLSSPLSPSETEQILSGLNVNSEKSFCSSSAAAAKIYCQSSALVPVRGPQPRVCIPPFFNYEYGVLPCRPGTEQVSEVQQSGIFFTQETLYRGSRVRIPDTHNNLNGAKFLPAAIASKLTLQQSSLTDLQSFFSVQKGSDMELDMQQTLAHCSTPSSHEVKACQASGESMVSFVVQNLGHNAAVYTPTAISKQEASVHDLALLNSEGTKVASCHDMKFPSLLYSCHVSTTSQLMEVTLRLDNGDVARQLAVCHMDTSYWSPSHVAFQVLETKPGGNPVCHWFPENSYVFIS